MTDETTPLSKTRRKEHMHALQDLGARLVELSEEQLLTLKLPDDLLVAVQEAKRLHAHEARRRQMQYIGKVMRRHELDWLETELTSLGATARQEAALLHRIERWRERLIADDAACNELLRDYADADAQQLRVLVRNARKERASGAPPKSSRALFKLLRELLNRDSPAEK